MSPCSSYRSLFEKFQAKTMLSLMGGLNYLMVFCCFASVCVNGRDSTASCEVEVMVRRGTTWKAAPRQSVTVSCPVKHCGRTLNVIWCKVVQSQGCEQLNETENVEIKQNHSHVSGELVSYLKFKQISAHDDGLYSCNIANGPSHLINISVSDVYKGIERPTFKEVKIPMAAVEGDSSWVAYLCISMGLILLVVTLTMLTLLRFYGWKRILTFNHAKGEEMPTHMIPDLPKWTDSSSPVLQSRVFVVSDIYSSATPETSKSPPEPSPAGDKPAVSNKADKSQAPASAVYAVINHRQPRMAARKQNAATKGDKNPQYAVIKVP